MIFKIVYKEMGGHTHFRFWAGKHLGSLGLVGAGTFTNEEFAEFKAIMESGVNFDQKAIFEEQVISGPTPRTGSIIE